jgi:ABC-type proline/glycine betaine transport system ATPase subunit
MLIDKGMIQQYGTKDEILNKPANQFVRDFIGSQYEN